MRETTYICLQVTVMSSFKKCIIFGGVIAYCLYGALNILNLSENKQDLYFTQNLVLNPVSNVILQVWGGGRDRC